MPKKRATPNRKVSVKKVGDIGSNGRKVTRVKKVGSRTYYFYGANDATKRASSKTKPKSSILGSGTAQKAGSMVSARNKRMKARIKKATGY